MAEDLMTPAVIDNSNVDAGLSSGNVEKTAVLDSPAAEPNTDTDDGPELSIDDSAEATEEKLLKLDKPQKKDAKQPVQAKQPLAKPSVKPTAEEDKDKEKSDKSAEEQVDDSFDLGEEEKEKEEEKKPEPVKSKRDYSDVTEDQKEILKHIPNYLLGKVKSYLKDNEKLKADHEKLKGDFEKVKTGQLPEVYFDHEKAYLLHPEYDKAQQLNSQLDFEEAHYEQQLAAIENGQDWWELVGYKDGQPQYKEHKALGNNKIDIAGRILAHKNLAIYTNKRNEVQQKLGEITSSFKQQHEATKQAYTMIGDKFFSKIKDIKALPEQAQTYYNQAKEYLNKTLPAFKDHPLVDFLAKSALSNIYKTSELKKLRAENKTLKEKGVDLVKAGPTSKDLSGGATVKNDKVYDINKLDADF